MAASPSPAGGGGAGAAHGSGPSSFAFDSGLEIKTRSVEQTLLPLVSQVKRRARPLILPPPAAARDGGGRSRWGPGRAGREAAAAPHSVPRLRRRRLVAFLGLEDWPSLRRRESGPSEIRLRGGETCADRSPAAGAPPGFPTRTAPRLRLRRPPALLPGSGGDPRGCSAGAQGPSSRPSHLCISSPNPDCSQSGWRVPPSPACSLP